MSLHTPGFTGTTPAPPALQKLLSFCCDLRHPTGNRHDLHFHPLAPQETETCQKPVCHGDGSQSLHQICRYSHTSPAESSSWSLLKSMNPNHLSFSFSEAFGLSKSISLPQASWSHAGICSLPAGKPEELCPATMHPLKPQRPPQLQPGQLLLHGTTCICRGPSK